MAFKKIILYILVLLLLVFVWFLQVFLYLDLSSCFQLECSHIELWLEKRFCLCNIRSMSHNWIFQVYFYHMLNSESKTKADKMTQKNIIWWMKNCSRGHPWSSQCERDLMCWLSRPVSHINPWNMSREPSTRNLMDSKWWRTGVPKNIVKYY